MVYWHLNRFVMDVNLLNIFFVVLAYAVMDATFRRANELLYVANKIKLKLGASGVWVWALGGVLRAVMFLIGLRMLPSSLRLALCLPFPCCFTFY